MSTEEVDVNEIHGEGRVNLADKEELTVPAAELAGSYYSKYKQQRKEFEDIWKVADYMIKVARNRSLNLDEMSQGVNPSWDTGDNEQAETGSTLFFKQIQKLASQLVSVAMSKEVPFKYNPVVSENVFASSDEAQAQAEQLNALAKWTLKHDRFALKFTEFAFKLKKYGNIPVMFYQHQKIARREVKEPVYEVVNDTANGVAELRIVDETVTEGDFLVENWPSWKAYNPDALFADIWIPDLNSQDCVILPSLMTRAQMLEKVKDGTWNEEQYRLVTSQYLWDGQENHDIRNSTMENQGMTSPDSKSTDMFLVWDIFIKCPITNNKWTASDESGDEEIEDIDIYFMTVVGNKIDDGIVVAFERNRDPDDEIPVVMIHSLPDDDILYHICEAQIVRSNYSVECTLKNQAIDNNSLINHPPLKEKEGEVRGTDRAFGPNTRFTVESMDSIDTFNIRDLSGTNMNLLEFIMNDTKEALSTVGNVLGDAYGSRTSALEAGNAYKNAIQPHMIAVEYILQQFLSVYARKMKSYWDAYAYPGQVLSISDENKMYSVYPAGLYGEFDIEVDVVNEYEADVVKNQRIFDVIQLAVSSPQVAEVLDLRELMTEYLRKNKMDAAKIVKPSFDFDARKRAREENAQMIYLGQTVPVNPEENHTIHLAEHEGERLKWNGKEDEYPGLSLLDNHIEETRNAIKSGQTGGSPAARQQLPQGSGDIAQQVLGPAVGGV